MTAAIRLPFTTGRTTDYSGGAWGSGTISRYAPYITLSGKIVWRNTDKVSLTDSHYEISVTQTGGALHNQPVEEDTLSTEQVDYLRGKLSEAKEARRIARNESRRETRLFAPQWKYYAEWLAVFVANGGWNGYDTRRVCWEQYGKPAFKKGIPAEQSGKFAALRYKAHTSRNQAAELSDTEFYAGLTAQANGYQARANDVYANV